MNFKRIVIMISLSLLCISGVFAHGKKDIEEKGVDNLNSWQQTFDLEGKKKGKYNAFITATDLGGNTYIEGPFNLLVDPDSDLCIPGITNPYQDMRVVGNLNIVGTCVDDDGVDYVELVLDGNEDMPIRAEGAEFWSYYLDTTNLDEGPHTIKVTGYDINGLKGKSTSLRWQLDRRQPVTAVKEKDMVTDKAMGELVSGSVRFAGLVEDGNGIKELYYSIDNGEHFFPLKIKINNKLNNAEFEVTVNTKNFPDGPNVIWFKAVDNAGSAGVYSFLYFIDNTKPDVQIISPARDEVVNGRFSVAGFAKDKVGITELTWTCGEESGTIDLVPGNPYWSLNFNAIGTKDKSRRFTIRATDIAGNIVEVGQTISIDSEKDKPVVTLSDPGPDASYTGGDEIFVRGFVVDDDNVEAVKVSVDGVEVVRHETKGAFSVSLGDAGQFSAGKHKISVSGIDENGVEGNPAVVEFASLGAAPQFQNIRIGSGKSSIPFVNGIEVHPESGSSFDLDIVSTIGIKAVHTEYLCGENEPIVTDVALKNATSQAVSIPFNTTRPCGVVQLRISATDVYDRVSNYSALVYVTNTSVIKRAAPAVVFDDSFVDSEGRIINNVEFPATGYLIGANAKSVELVPATPFATATLYGNQIELTPGSAVGTSAPVIVRVTTDKGDKIDSIPLTFVNDTEIPDLSIDGYSPTDAIDAYAQEVKIKGKATCKTGMSKVQYRVFSVPVDMAKGVVSKVNAASVNSFQTVTLEKNGSFEIGMDASSLGDGIYLIEIVAESAAGNTITKGVAVKKIPEVVADDNGKVPAIKAPSIVWLDGTDVYAVGVYQGVLSETFATFTRQEMVEGSNALSWQTTGEDGKPVAGKYTASKNPTLSAHFAFVNRETYRSGMPIVMASGTEKNAETISVVAYIDTGAAVGSANFEVVSDNGSVIQSGAAKLIKPQAGDIRWSAEIPLKNLPAGVAKIKLRIKAGSLESELIGSILLARPEDNIVADDVEKIYLMTTPEVLYNAETKQYSMNRDSKFYLYGNYAAPLSAEFVTAVDGLVIETDNKLVTISVTKDDIFNNVRVRIKDALGKVHDSEAFNLLVDSGAPEMNVLTPLNQDWVGKSFVLSGTVADVIGVSKVEYSIDGGLTWNNVSLKANAGDKMNRGVTFNQTVDVSAMEEGLITLDVRTTDYMGNSIVKHIALQKDITPPEVQVVLPLDSDIVNGETLVVFSAKDNGYLAKTNYIAPQKGRTPSEPVEIEMNPLISTYVGNEERPINDAMAFEFSDDAGNKTRISSWNFLIDNESDIPTSEVHLPEDNQVITRDFTISGVVYDDDGDADIYYKIDNGEYKHYPEMGTSFSIDIPLSDMTDNEHTVTVYAVDVNGVKGPETVRRFRVSLEEPKGSVEYPEIDISVRELITITGWATDKNGIGRVQVSLDNGNTYNDAVITKSESERAEWSYTVDTRAIPGGTQVVFLKITDKYDIQGLYSSLINIDNEDPHLSLDLPADDSTTTGYLFFSGYSYDNVDITEMYVTIRNMETTDKPFVTNFEIERVIGKTLDIKQLKDGFYNVELTAKDKAGNVTNVSRNIHLEKNKPAAVVDLLYPLNGEHKTGEFNIYGQAESELSIETLKLYVDKKYVSETTLTHSGFYKFGVTPDMIADGVHSYYVEAVLEDGKTISSRTQTITYSSYGPWVTLDNFTYGDFATNRPYLNGRAGYSISEDEVLYAKSKEAPPEAKDALAAKSVKIIELSFDNGKTFIPLSEKDKWKYRIENQDLPEGYHFLLVRATMKNGETAIERTIVQIDNTKPRIQLIAPSVGGRYNQELMFSGLSSDDVELQDVNITFRKGDKSSYEVPAFFQGMYLDASVWGASLFSVGLGFTAFDDVVKIQLSWGEFTQAQRNAVLQFFKQDVTDLRYGGDIIGLKILANIASIPFSFFFGHDWEWLYAAFAVGANFSYFTETNSGEGQILSALLGQIEFPRIQFNGAKMFSTLSVYTEGSLWFIPSDVANKDEIKRLVPTFSVGIRVNIF